MRVRVTGLEAQKWGTFNLKRGHSEEVGGVRQMRAGVMGLEAQKWGTGGKWE